MRKRQPIDGFPIDLLAGSFYQIRVASSSHICRGNWVVWIFTENCYRSIENTPYIRSTTVGLISK